MTEMKCSFHVRGFLEEKLSKPEKPFLILFLVTMILLFTASFGCEQAHSKEEVSAGNTKLVELYPLLADSPLAGAELTSLPKETLLRSGDIEISVQEIDGQVNAASQRVREQLKDNLFFVLEQQFTEMVLLKEARENLIQNGTDTANMNERQIFETFFGQLTSNIEVSEEEVNEFYEANKEVMGGMPLEQAKPQIEFYLKQQKQQQIVEDFVSQTVSGKKVELADDWAREHAAKSLDNAIDKARKSGKPSFVSFGSDTCVPCQQMIPAREAVREIYEGKANVVYIHVDKDQFLASRYGVQSIPTLVFFDKNGVERNRHVGIMTQQQIEDQLNVLLD